MSTTRIKIVGTPKQKPELPKINPFQDLDTPKMEYGGQKPGANGTGVYGSNRYLDTSWGWLKSNDKANEYEVNPFSAVGKNLPEADPEDATINAEKQEQIMGDFNGDGMPVLMNVNGPSHKQGGKDIAAPSNSFVFSDTANLRIKDKDVLAQFGGGTKPATPAKLAKKYDLQKFKAVLDNPDADELDKKTAKLMYTNYVNKLNMLAANQEAMKERKGLGDKSVPEMGMYQTGGSLTDNNVLPGQSVTAKRSNHYQYQQPDMQFPVDNTLADVPDMPYDISQFPIPVENPGDNSVTTMDNNQSGNRKQFNIPNVQLNPDQMRNYILALKAGSYPNYTPIRQIANYAVPNTVFMDPTRAKAAITEQANMASQNAAMSGNGPIGRANAIAASGVAGSQIANVEGQYANQNAQIANQANQQAAQEYNRAFQQQQDYNKEYNEETANALKDRYGAHSAMMNEYLKGQYEDEARKRNYAWADKMNPYYGFDSRGMPVNKTEAQKQKILSIIGAKGPAGGPGGDAEVWSNLWKEAKSKGLSDEMAAVYVKHHVGDRERAQYDAQGRLKSSTKTGYEDESGVPPAYRKYGGMSNKKSKVKITGTP